MSDNNNQVLSDVDSQGGESEFEGNVVMPVVNSSNEVSTDTSFSNSDSSSLLSSDYSTDEEEKVQEPEIITGIGRSTQTNPLPFCGICYKDLTVVDNVTTNCNHHFCNTCFFRWLEVNATCPSCRTPIDSKTNLTDEQLQREYSEVYSLYEEKLTRYCNQVDRNKEKIVEMYDLREKTNDLLKRQISLRQQMMETEGYNEGYMAAAFEFFHSEGKYTSDIYEVNKHRKGFMRGFNAGATTESRRLHKLAGEYKKKSIKNIKIKKRKVQQSLWDCGIYEKEDPNPFRNVTIGLSEDEDEDEYIEIPFDDVENEYLDPDESAPSPINMVRTIDEITDIVAEMVI